MSALGTFCTIGIDRGHLGCRTRVRWCAAVALVAPSILCLGHGTAHAHGAVSMDADICKLKIAGYFMHFAGYQPDLSRTEFCEDIPSAGRTVIVLDFIDDALRDQAVSVHIVKRQGTAMTATDSGILDIPPRKYPNGTITVRVDLPDNGNYLGMVSMGERGENVASFPFAVGRNTMLLPIVASAAAVLAGAGLVFFWVMRGMATRRPTGGDLHA